MKNKTWVLKRRASNLPLSRYRSRTKTDGKWDTPRMCVTFDNSKAMRFEDRQDALFYLENKREKYGKQVNSWVPIKIETLVQAQKKKPIRQLHTNKILNWWKS